MSSLDATAMLQAASGLLALGAGGGLVMATIRLAGKRNPPAWLSMLHGFMAAAGLTLIGYAACTVGVPASALWALGLLAAAAMGGVLLNLVYRSRGILLPATIVVAHALLAVTGFACLLVAAFVD